MRKQRRCRGPVNRLLTLRTKGGHGPLFQNVGGGVCVKGTGNFYAPGMPGSGPQAVLGVVIDANTIQITFTRCVSIPVATGIEYNIDGGAWLPMTLPVEISPTVWQFTAGTAINPGDEVRWRYVGESGSIVDCEESQDIGDQGPLPVENPLVLAGDFILLETGGMDIFLLEDDVDGTNGINTEERDP